MGRMEGFRRLRGGELSLGRLSLLIFCFFVAFLFVAGAFGYRLLFFYLLDSAKRKGGKGKSWLFAFARQVGRVPSFTLMRVLTLRIR
jgi:hypothetical protein